MADLVPQELTDLSQSLVMQSEMVATDGIFLLLLAVLGVIALVSFYGLLRLRAWAPRRPCGLLRRLGAYMFQSAGCAVRPDQRDIGLGLCAVWCSACIAVLRARCARDVLALQVRDLNKKPCEGLFYGKALWAIKSRLPDVMRSKPSSGGRLLAAGRDGAEVLRWRTDSTKPVVCLSTRPNRLLSVKQNWMAASENYGLRPAFAAAIRKPGHALVQSDG